MRLLPLIFLITVNINACKAQQEKSIEKLFLKDFIKDNMDDKRFFAGNKLYIWGSGNDYLEKDIQVIFLSLEESREKVKKDGEFNLVRMKEITIEGRMLKTSFIFLTAKKDRDVDFTYMDNSNASYCIKFSRSGKKIETFWCGDVPK